MNKQAVVQRILKGRFQHKRTHGQGFAPSNIALCKYWGKQNDELNVPTTPSLSISLGKWGAHTKIYPIDLLEDIIYLNGQKIDADSAFYQRLTTYLDLFRFETKTHFKIETDINLPVGAGLASSACGIAAVVKALDNLYDLELTNQELSILGRLGSGSACRSFWQGFVEWQVGIEPDGRDSFAVPMSLSWPELRIGLLIVNRAEKTVSSREGMKRTMLTSPFYSEWPTKHALDFARLKQAIFDQDFAMLGATAESNALAMHALMMTAWPPLVYSEPNTLEAMQTVWRCRQKGLSVFFTQDAGPNLKLLFLEKEIELVHSIFPMIEIIAPFEALEKIC